VGGGAGECAGSAGACACASAARIAACGAAGGVGANAEGGQGGEGGAGATAGGAGGNNYSRNPSISGGSWNGAVGGNGGNGEQCCSNRAGGGGGSGFGGGSGGLSGDNNSGAGGGGSSYFSGTLVTSASGSAQAAGQWANADNLSAFGGGGNANSNGQNGRIVISVAELTTAGVLSVSAPGYTGGSTIDVCPGTQITVTRGGGSGTANYWAGDETNALEIWGYFDNQQYGNSFNYTFNNPGFYLIRTHPSNSCGYNYAEVSDVRVYVRPVDAKAISGDQAICLSAIPSAFSGGTPDNGAGTFTYNWQQSTDNGVTWTDAVGIRNNATYNASNINSETLFKRQVTSRGCVITEGELVNWAWTSGNVWTANNSIKKFNTRPDAWDEGAISSQSITNNGGYVEATTFKVDGAQMIGLGNYDTDPSYISIEFAIHAINGIVQVYESGIYRGDFTTYARGDVMRVAVENNQIRYYKNGVWFYTSLVTPTFPLYADAAVYAGGNAGVANGPYGVSSGFKFVRIFNPVKVSPSLQPNLVSINNSVNPDMSNGDYLWNGNTSNNWSNTINWYVLNNSVFEAASTLPDNTRNVFIVDDAIAVQCVHNTNTPTISAVANTNNIYIDNDAVLTVTGTNEINVNGNWINEGTFVPATSTVNFVGTTNTTITSGGFNGRFNNLNINKNSNNNTVAFSDNFEAIDKIDITQGELIVPTSIVGRAKKVDLKSGVNAAKLNIQSQGQLRVNE
jgi:hypothetical protein